MISLFFYCVTVCIAAYVINKWYRKDYIKDFHRKNVFITGTDSGFGRKLALDLDRKGLTVYAGCYTTNGADDLRKEASSRMRIFPLDVTNRDTIIKAREIVERDLQPNQGLWAVVNNAGIAKSIFFDFAVVNDYREVMSVNFYGPIEVIEVFLPLIKRAQGRIINLVSIAGRCHYGSNPYVTSKFAYESYSDGLRHSMVPFGVKVSIIEPGAFRTNITDINRLLNDIDYCWNQLPEELKEEYTPEILKIVKDAHEKLMRDPPLSSFNTLDLVTESITHAVGAKHPKDRYVVGLDAQLLHRPSSFLPDFIMDFIMFWISKNFIDTMKKRLQKIRKNPAY